MNIFTYGSLMVQSIFIAVTGRQVNSQRATLSGYARYCVKQELYPGIIEASGSMTDGMVYFDVDDFSLEKLDAFEGDYYVRTPVRVSLDNHEVIRAETYVVKPDYRHVLSAREWDFKEFKHKFKDEFIRKYVSFSAIDPDGSRS